MAEIIIADGVPEWQQRVMVEHNELDSKIEKLEKYIHTNKLYEQLPTEHRELLTQQLRVMVEYRHILESRIEFF